MLFRTQLQIELNCKAHDFRIVAEDQRAEIAHCLTALDKLCRTDGETLDRMFALHENPGAVPSAEITRESGFAVDFDRSWTNHEQSREWAKTVLEGRTTFAADGSQIYAGKETFAPVAAVQIGWFENPHNSKVPYEKNASFEVLTPTDLFCENDEPMNPDVRVEERRFLREVEKIEEFLRAKKGWLERGERMPAAFFDNPLLVPFSQKGLQNSFVEATVRLVELSAETMVPVIGYVDRSFARDVLTMLDNFADKSLHTRSTIYDASLVASLIEKWGSRTCFCFSKRRGLSRFLDRSTGQSKVGFVYLRMASTGTPVRLDIPAWVYESGHIEEVVDVVRAECVIGVGYPYALETADQTAVISTRDREIFFAALQDFANREKLGFEVSRKDGSKSRRR